MHGTGHWLGLDVHDAGSTEVDGQPRQFKNGMVTTVEPGIYVRPTKPVIEFPLIERDPKKIRERRKLLGMEKATILEKEEISNAKTRAHSCQLASAQAEPNHWPVQVSYCFFCAECCANI